MELEMKTKESVFNQYLEIKRSFDPQNWKKSF